MGSSDRADGPAIELREVSKRFGGRAVIDGTSLTVGRGEFLALIGPSGSGKSTLLKLVSGIESPDSGRVLLSGQDVTEQPPYRRRVHTVFQNYALFPHLDVAGNVGFPLRMAGVDRRTRSARVAQALDWVELGPFASRRVEALSGGERQRVALARALVSESEAVLLDEPLSALDPHLRTQTLELLQDIQERLKVAYLYVTHDREEALRAAHRVGVLNQGRLEQVGPPEEIYRRPVSPFVASFIGPINWLSGERSEQGDGWVELSGGPRVPTTSRTLPAGPKLLLGVRPQDLWLGLEGFLGARIVGRQFSGTSVSLRLMSELGVPLTAELRADVETPPVGTDVRVSWSPEEAHIFGVAP